MVELYFRHIKMETYTHLHSNIESIKQNINNILDGENVKKLKTFFIEEHLENI